MFDTQDPLVKAALARSSGLKAIEGIAHQVRAAIANGTKINLVACGPLTNIALFISVYPELLGGVEQVCFMGGGKTLTGLSVIVGLTYLDHSQGVGVGNRSAVAGASIILCNPRRLN